MLLRNLLITTLWGLLPMTVYAATPLCGSSTAVVENWKGEYIQTDEDLISTPEKLEYANEPVDEDLISTLDELGHANETVDEDLISTLEYELDLIELETEQDEE